MQPKDSRGAFLVISMILLIVLTGVVLAGMSLSVSSFRVSRNYSNLIQAQTKAISMAGYGQRLLDSYVATKFPLPKTCNTSGTCNVINNTFPYSGRPTMAWDSGLNTDNLIATSGSNSWWTTNGLAYESTFGGGGNARVIVSLVGAQPRMPWLHTYNVVGYATDNNGLARSTQDVFYSIAGYRPDPYPATSGTNVYSSSGCTGGCPYGQCCSGSTCSSNQATCESAAETYVPAGWFCNEYFITALGYASSSCNNFAAWVFNGMNVLETVMRDAFAYRQANGSFPNSVVINNITIPHTTWTALSNYQGVSDFAYERNASGMMAHVVLPNVSGKILSYAIRDNNDGTVNSVCGAFSLSSIPNDPVPPQYLPPNCTCDEVNAWFTNGTGC